MVGEAKWYNIFRGELQAISECYGKKQCFFKEQIEMAVILKNQQQLTFYWKAKN
jgi:hypothetical protein